MFMAFSSFGDLARRHLKRAPYRRSLAATSAVAEVRSWVVAMWGPEALQYIRTCYVRDGVLHLGVQSASFAQSARLKQEELLTHLKQSISGIKLEGVHIFVGG